MVASGTPSTTYWETVPVGGMGAGYFNGTVKTERSFFDMTVPSTLLGAPVTVLSATLTGTVSHAGSSASTSHTVNLYSAGAVGHVVGHHARAFSEPSGVCDVHHGECHSGLGSVLGREVDDPGRRRQRPL